MARKTLKQKLKFSVRQAKADAAQQREHFNLTINFEMQRLQPIALAHGLMGTLAEVGNVLDKESEEYKAIEGPTHLRIAQCVAALLATGMELPEINKRIQQGH